MTTMDLIILLFFVLIFAERSGQTPRNFEGQNTAGNVNGSKQNFQLSDPVNSHVSVTSACKALCLLLNSASNKSLF